MTARRLNWILAVCLALMTVVATLSAGAAAFMLRNPGQVLAATQAFETYPRPLRQALRVELRGAAQRFRPQVAEYDRARTAMFEAMRAEPFDRQALEAAMADVRSAVSALQAGTQAVLADTIESAGPDLRQRINPPRRSAVSRLDDVVTR